MSLLPESMNRIRSRTAEKKLQHRFSNYKGYENFFRRSRAANTPLVGSSQLLVIVTCKYGKERMKKSRELDLMFMKHYAPNRCLYIKVAKLRTGVGSAETSYLQNCSV